MVSQMIYNTEGSTAGIILHHFPAERYRPSPTRFVDSRIQIRGTEGRS